MSVVLALCQETAHHHTDGHRYPFLPQLRLWAGLDVGSSRSGPACRSCDDSRWMQTALSYQCSPFSG